MVTGIHWKCAGANLKIICRRILRWPSKLLKVPQGMSSFMAISGRKGNTYSEINPAMIQSDKVKAELMALPKEAPEIVPLLSILPDEWKEKYAKEENLVRNEEAAWNNMRKCRPRLGMEVSEYVKIIKLLHELGMIVLLTARQIKVSNGLHCVVKDTGKQRLIFDGRPVNHVLIEPDKVVLLDFALLEDWEVKSGEVIRFGKLDLDNFYHRLGVPKWLIPFLGLPPIEGEKVGVEMDTCYPACCTLPMGLSHSVLLAQTAHLYVLKEISMAPVINVKVGKKVMVWLIVYIDDVIVSAKGVSRDSVEKVVNNCIEECLKVYSQSGLVINANKLQWATSEIWGLGCLFSENKCGIIPKEERIRQVVSATGYMLNLHVISPKSVEFMVGHWIWFILLYRPLFSNFFHVYRWLKKGDEYTVRPLWQSVEREFILIILFADLCRLSWKRKIAPEMLAMDASLWGAGACELTRTLKDDEEEGNRSRPLKLYGHWQKLLNFKWKREEHINILEMRALIMSTSARIMHIRFYDTRWRVFSDSSVVVGAVKKGRSSSYMLCCLLRRLLTVCLLMNVSIIMEWIASDDNPADVFSREFVPGSAADGQNNQEADDWTGFIYSESEVGEVKFDNLDEQLLDYVQSFPPLSQRSAGERIGCACRHFFAEITNSLPRLNRFLHQLRRQHRGISKPPMIWDVVVLVVFQLVAMGFPVTALGVLLQFDCFLRPNELAQIQIKHIAFPGGKLLGSQAQRVLLLLPKAKTGPLQSVRIQSKLVIKLLRKAAKKNSLNVELFPSVSVYSQRLSKTLNVLGLNHIGYTPHSIRHGAATMALINDGEQTLPAIMFRGRWESSAGKSYLQMGAAALLYAEIPEALIRQAEDQMGEMSKIFKHLEWIPKV